MSTSISISNFKIQIQIRKQFCFSWYAGGRGNTTQTSEAVRSDCDFHFLKSNQINTNFDKASPQGKWKFFNSTRILSVTVPRVNQSYNFKGTCNLSRNLCNHVNFVFVVTTCSSVESVSQSIRAVRAVRAVRAIPRVNSPIELSERRSLSDL